MIVLSIAAFTLYGAFNINELNGQNNSLKKQIIDNNSVSMALTLMLFAGIILLIIERFIYKYNPKEWREKLDGKKINRKPQSTEELHDSIKFEIKAGTE